MTFPANAPQALVRRHLEGMHANSPACSVHALGIDKLRQPGVTLWSGWIGDELVVIGALKRLDAENGEIKSMRVEQAWLGKGIGWTDAQSHNAGRQARRDEGAVAGDGIWRMLSFPRSSSMRAQVSCSAGRLSDYTDDPFSVFMMKAL